MPDDRDFDSLIQFLLQVLVISGSIGKGHFEDGNWWVKFHIDIAHPLAWNVVQELGFCLKGSILHR